MTVSVFTTASNPLERMDLWHEALLSYGFADEIVVMNGGDKLPETYASIERKMKVIDYKWPREFEWKFIGEQFNRGYQACTSDWCIRLDLDQLIHEGSWAELKRTLMNNQNEPALSMWKYQFILPDRYTLKSRVVNIVNKKMYGDRIKFDSGGDLCQPSLDGKELRSDEMKEAKLPFYNYDFICKTESTIRDDFPRFSRAWGKYKGEYSWGGPDEESSYKFWLNMMIGRFKRDSEHINLNEHPKFIIMKIKSLLEQQWGYNGFGHLERNDYAKSSMRSR